jgi:NADH-quinone oxidoreductase E subunit
METKFRFTEDNAQKAREVIGNYPPSRQRSAILALLDMAQRQNGGWLSRSCIEYIADLLDTPYIRAYEVASFYTMFNLKPVGKYHIQVCGTTPCWLRGAAEVMKICETEKDNPDFTISEVECLGACVNAPMVQINDDYYEDLTPEIMTDLIKKLKDGESIKPGSQIGRQTSAAAE